MKNFTQTIAMFGVLLSSATLLAGPKAYAEVVLWSDSFTEQGGSRAILDAVDVHFAVSLPSGLSQTYPNNFFVVLFQREFISFTSAPNIIRADQTSSDVWDIFTEFMTAEDVLVDTITISGGINGFRNDVFPGSEVLIDAELEAVEVELLSADFESPGRDPNRDGLWTDYEFSYELRFLGQIPEPNLATFCLALPLILKRPSRRQKSIV
ncbi:MAG: hypothetical protein AAF916_06360 [Planctomycetota bacterium]